MSQRKEFVPRLSVFINYTFFMHIVSRCYSAEKLDLDHAESKGLSVQYILSGYSSQNDEVDPIDVSRSFQDPKPVK